ncbi:hypothetical protein A606_09735 [Corynebacterium terpenotabidum Y-11]|uniref:Uncharacterized protein n=1 Tax=Corynebacterium terpenotabidum Y-11 TaxID=1200352 RepID=S4XGC2_9CORY|nr:hypothetical protein A606_09735 [Corynebacterium terpenotabidum Y-11]
MVQVLWGLWLLLPDALLPVPVVFTAVVVAALVVVVVVQGAPGFPGIVGGCARTSRSFSCSPQSLWRR